MADGQRVFAGRQIGKRYRQARDSRFHDPALHCTFMFGRKAAG
jgi:hypothetical protein